MFRRRAPASADAAARAPRATLWPAVFCVLAGFATLLAFEPFGWWPVQLLSFGLMFYLVGLDLRVRRAAVLGWAFGFGWSVAGMHWLFVAMHRYGGMPAPMAALAVCLLATYMALFAAWPCPCPPSCCLCCPPPGPSPNGCAAGSSPVFPGPLPAMPIPTARWPATPR